jgi:hypothetical protein
MSRTTLRQHRGQMFDRSLGHTFSHEMRTFVAKDMKTGQGEISTSATTMKVARRNIHEELGHMAFIMLAESPMVSRK